MDLTWTWHGLDPQDLRMSFCTNFNLSAGCRQSCWINVNHQIRCALQQYHSDKIGGAIFAVWLEMVWRENPIEEQRSEKGETHGSWRDEMGCWTTDVSYVLLWCSEFQCDQTWSTTALQTAYMFPFLTLTEGSTKAETGNDGDAKIFIRGLVCSAIWFHFDSSPQKKVSQPESLLELVEFFMTCWICYGWYLHL